MYEIEDIDKYDGKNNLRTWQCEVMNILAEEDLEVVLEGKPSYMEEDEWRKLDTYACSIIWCYLSKEIKSTITSETMSAKEVWEKLENCIVETSAKRINLKKKLHRFTMGENTTMEDHIKEFNKLLKELSDSNVRLTEEDKVAVLLASLPESFDPSLKSMLDEDDDVCLDVAISILLSPS